MFTQQDKSYLTELQSSNPEIYNYIHHLMTEFHQDVRLGCHDIANILSLVFGNFQLLELTTPELTTNPHWQLMNEDLRFLVSALESISTYRYSHIINKKALSLNNYIESELSLLTASSEYAGLKITIHPTTDNRVINIDTAKITFVVKSILDNVVDNNCDAMVDIYFKTDTDNLKIIITDNCSVIAKETMKKLFKPFNASKTTNIGLSLASSYQIMMAHDGSIDISPINDKGITCTLCLPL